MSHRLPIMSKTCAQCAATFERTSSAQNIKQKFCSVACARANQVGRPHRCTPRNLSRRPCEHCRTEYQPREARSRFCSRVCMNAGLRGDRAVNWKGGTHLNVHGYVKVLIRGRGYVLEHRYVMEQLLGRRLRHDETVHHINGNRTDNRPENLQLRIGRHGFGAALVCGDCGSCNIVPAPLGAASQE